RKIGGGASGSENPRPTATLILPTGDPKRNALQVNPPHEL
ncbi:hypothetical protein HMPREF9440_02335, partial [Sutterella parvirubra YIT 11816]